MTFTSFCVSALAIASQANALSWEQPAGLPRYGSFFGLPGKNATYDYVIVGGGTAGLTGSWRLRLSRYVSFHVLLGKPVADDLEQQLHGRQIFYAQGKALGGSRIHNQMIHQRGSRGSYDLWAEQVGDDSYKWDNIVKYFDKGVDVTPYNNSLRAANASANTEQYNLAAKLQSGGPLKVSWPNFAMPFSSWRIQGLFASGMPHLSGFFSSGDLHGAAYNVSANRLKAD